MKRNLVYVVGLGPGDPQFLTAQAKTALENADVLCGYTVYIDLIRSFYPEKEVHATGMTKEIDRCRWALETAQSGKTVALVCSGDAGVYGMASPILELAPNYPSVEIEVIPGLTAALSGGAVLGAPLAHDFCVISLSDRLTPWEIIEKRLACAAMGDFCVAIYNPSSKARPDYLQRAVRILLQNGKSEETVCGIVRNIGRERQQSAIITLRELENKQVDMFTTVYIGNKTTKEYRKQNGNAKGVSHGMKAVVFSGTTEGRQFSKILANLGVKVLVSVATEIGAEEQDKNENITIHVGRCTVAEMTKLCTARQSVWTQRTPMQQKPRAPFVKRVKRQALSTIDCSVPKANCRRTVSCLKRQQKRQNISKVLPGISCSRPVQRSCLLLKI